ncbi:MAG: GNAT family N-acetyltransferase [Solirubrobacteraceae bacterium]
MGGPLTAVEVRLAREDELRPAVRALSEAGFGPHVGRLIDWPWQQPAGCVLVALGRLRRIVGGACCASFGTTGWIGALGVVPRARGRGAGSALTEACVEWLRARGAETVLLHATDAGRPVYERVGFVAEGRSRAWRGGPSHPPHGYGLRALRPADREAIGALDQRITGERRDPVLDAVAPLSGLAAERDGQLRGYLLASPWGAGPAVLADDPEAGLDLLSAARGATQGPSILTLPDENTTAVRALESWGFRAVNHAERMRLGPPVGWHPEGLFGMYNLFWG